MSQSPPKGNAKPPRSTSDSLQQLWRQTQPVLKAGTVRSLRGTIWLLEQAVTKLEAQPPVVPPVPPASVSPTSPADSPPTTAVVTPPPVTPTPSSPSPAGETLPSAGATPPPVSATPPSAPPAKSTEPTLSSQIRAVWAWLLESVRSLLPRSVREKLSDTALGGILIGTVVLLWVNSGKKPDQLKATVATRPAIEQPAVDIPDTLPAPAEPVPAEPAPIEPIPAIELAPIEPPVAVAPEPPAESFASEPSVSPEEFAIEPPTSPEELEIPAPEPEVTAEPPQAIEPVKPVPLELTPEQALIAAIQEQVAKITNQYADGLIETIQANFRSSRLIVKVDDAWYGLSASRQNRLAAEMLDRAQALNFSRLEIADAEGTLIARSPVVGSEMIILRRDRA